jgi:hypothetical protein
MGYQVLDLLELFFASWRSLALNLALKLRRKKGRTIEEMWLPAVGCGIIVLIINNPRPAGPGQTILAAAQPQEISPVVRMLGSRALQVFCYTCLSLFGT